MSRCEDALVFISPELSHLLVNCRRPASLRILRPLALKPLLLEERIKVDCGKEDRCVIAEGVVLLNLVPGVVAVV